MPHKQKESHDHSAKSKRERQRAKEERQARKQAAIDARLKAEAEAALVKPNNIALVEGAGAYEVGCEAEPDIPVRFNINKRSKKHLRQDARRIAERQEREEQERLQREQEERWKQEQKEREELQRQLEGGSQPDEDEEEEEEEEGEEYLVYICECCGKKYATTNQFANHANSRKHRANAAEYEEAGIIVTSVQLKLRLDDDDQYQEYKDNHFDEFEFGNGDSDSDSDIDIDEEDCEDDEYYDENEGEAEDETEGEESEEEEYEPPKQQKVNLFSALMDDSSSSESEGDDSDDEQGGKPTPTQQTQTARATAATISDDDDNHDDEEQLDDQEEEMLEEIIQQNRILQSEIDAENENAPVASVPTPLPFDNDQYDPDHFAPNEKRLVSVHHRLQKKLAAKGIEPTRSIGSYGASDAVSIGKTLLQQLMEANKDTLEARLEAYNKHKTECQLLNKGFAFAKGNSKALASQYVYKPGVADDARKRANVHHTGSHYHMQAARSMQFGRMKGMMARHSSQGARLQAKRMATKEMARMQTGGGGMKIGKTSKKSKQKSQGEAGGSKKTGGTAGEK